MGLLNRGGPLSKMVGGTIGLAKEYSADRKERKAANEDQSNASSSHQKHDNHDHSDDSSDYEDDWLLDLDEAQQLQNSTGYSPQNADGDFDANQFAQSFPYPAAQRQIQTLSMPVIIPQRRPKSEHKGFVRAYAPILNECGIDQATWLRFLDGIEQSMKQNSWFHVANAGVLVANSATAITMGIEPLIHMASMVLHVAIEAGRRGYLNYVQNKYLDIMNEKLFKPRGLFCMITKYQPSSTEILEEVDLNTNVARAVGKQENKSTWNSVTSGTSMTVKNDVELPTPAPLIFPDLDNMPEGQKLGTFKQFGNLVDDYKNRRAAATFAAENPNSKMPTAPQKEFASVYGDPNSAANQGGFISMATGGKYNPVGPSGAKHDQRRERMQARKSKKEARKSKNPINKVIKMDALYLMVVPLPSEETMARVAAQMESKQE